MVRNAILLGLAVILALMLSLQVTPPSSSQRKTEIEDEGDVVRERIEWFKKRHPQLDPKLRLKSVRDEYQAREALKKRLGPRQTAAATWVSAGPSNGAGRINSIAVHPTTSGTVYIATNSGGVWKTTDGGETWRSLTDSINNLNAGAIALAPSNPNIVYVGTGSEHAGGIGLLKSTDGGETWQFPSDVIAFRFFRISVHPTNPLELVAASDRGALRSTDGGNTWTVGIPPNPYFHVTDVQRDPTNPLVLYAAATTGDGARILKSTDGGVSFTEKMVGLSAVLDPISLAITPSNPRVVYALTATRPGGPVVSHLFRTTDAAETWQDVIGFALDSGTNRILGGQAWHDNTVVVSPSNANEITVGGISYRRSLDGGATWFVPFCDNVSCLPMHPDWTDQQYQGSTLWIACDGGVYSAQGNAAAAHNQGLPIREYYVMSNHPILANSFLAGSQDNGTDWRPPAGGTELLLMPVCDGFDTAVNPQNPSLAYATCQNGHIRRTTGFGVNPNIFASSDIISPAVQAGDGRPFATRLVMDPNQPATLYTVSLRHVWKTQDNGDSWTALPNTVTDGSTLDGLDNVAVAKSNGNVLIAWSQFDLFRSTDGGATWSRRSPGDIVYGADIDPTDANVIYVGSRSCFGCAGAFITTDGGNTWSPRGKGLPDLSGNLSIRVDPIDPNTLYCGTEKGVFTTSDRGQNWTVLGSGLPSIWVEDLRISKDGSMLRAATYGRGVWELQLRPSETANISGRVTDANDAGIQGATITVGLQQNVITTMLTDQNGNYTFLKLARGRDYTVSAAKTGIELTPAAITMTNLTSDQTANFTVAAPPTPTPTPTPTPFPIQLFTEESGNTADQVAVLDASLFVRDPFPVVGGLSALLGGETNRRVMIFASNLQLAQGDPSSAVVVNLIDSNNKTYDIPAEDVRSVPNFPFLQIIFRLPDNLPVGNCTVRVTVHGQLSNLGVFRIRI